MARQTGWLTFTGRLGNHIGYRRNGTYFLRSMPSSVHQTTATKQAARRFGIASRKARLIRQACIPAINIPQDGHIVNHLNKHCLRAGSDITALNGFRFNKHNGLDKYCIAIPQLLPHHQLLIPPGAFHTNTPSLQLKLVAVRLNFNTLRITASRTSIIHINTQQPFHGLLLDCSLPGHGSLLLILQITPSSPQRRKTSKRAIVADIIAVIPPSQPISPSTYIPRTQQEHPTAQQLVELPKSGFHRTLAVPRE
ncbi:hypothetical protein KTO58_08095 [Chitinophaga pendula]|uniref:hypothetical protein n=1 Tax=Chitinophaga TaxID=79328 RepID=UPI000BAFDC57|nr:MULTISPECIES: hypothetical protein [Chitinophaga]ASZ13248.1 hypothetical protein CK934_20915 [Chitinophaga sp. MD30]UCJ09132.1 hypothetical protein KTO58_08095 [Chitinophaga pendula]